MPSSLLTPPGAPDPKPSLAETIQSLLLRRLGLQSQPDPRPGVPVPRYLLDLYRFHQQQYHLVEDPLFSFPRQHIQQANTVRSFHHNGEPAYQRPISLVYYAVIRLLGNDKSRWLLLLLLRLALHKCKDPIYDHSLI